MIVVFLAIVTLANGSFASALEEFKKIRYWILLLCGGFGLQVALFVYLKNAVHGPMAGASAEVAASGTVSTGSMLACCSHALASLLPIIGVSAAAAFLTRFQVPLLLLGVFSNLTGLTIMLGLFQRHQLLAAGSFITRLNMRTIRRAVIGSGIIAFGCAIILAARRKHTIGLLIGLLRDRETDEQRKAREAEIPLSNCNYSLGPVGPGR